MDPTCISQALGLLGTGVVFVGVVITGVGLFIGWRRALARYSRRAEELRAALEKPMPKHDTAEANLTLEAKLSALATRLPGPDAPISRSQLITVIGDLQKEIQKVANDVRDDIREVRTAVATAIASAVTDEGVKATTHGMLAEYEHRENANTRRDLRWALVGIAIQAFGAIITGLGVIVGM